MTRVDFYVVQRGGLDEKLRVACRLAQKAFRSGQRVYVHAGNEQQAGRLDELLWTFAPDSFVPHRLVRPGSPQPQPPDPVAVGFADPPESFDNVLVSVGTDVPAFFGRFDRLLDVVSDDPDDRASGRERFRFYRDRGYALETHDI